MGERQAYERPVGDDRWDSCNVSERSVVGVRLWSQEPGVVIEYDGWEYKWEVVGDAG